MTPIIASSRLGGWALFSGMIAAAGLPIYINAPKFYVDEYGIGLGTLGAVLFGLRLIDVVQDPVLGWLADRAERWRGLLVGLCIMLVAASMVGLFAVTPPIDPLWWFALVLVVLFSAYSFLAITFYAQGVVKAAALGTEGHLRLAGWREAGSLIGVSLAAVAPVAFASMMDAPFTGFALGFAVVALAAGWAMRGEWRAGDVSLQRGPTLNDPALGLRDILQDAFARRLLVLALVNAMPVAVTSTLFLFFVESRLNSAAASGPLLLLFFLSAAASTFAWSWAAQRFGSKSVLVVGMLLAVVSFGFAYGLGAGDVVGFALICVVSGASMGADMTLLPAMFARRVAVLARGASVGAGAGFGLWNFVSKVSLAVVAATVLPLLQMRGFVSGAENPPQVLAALSGLYAGVPCILKLVAIGLLVALPIKEV